MNGSRSREQEISVSVVICYNKNRIRISKSLFPCFEINTKFVEHLLFDLIEKYEIESSKNEETNDNSVEDVEEDTVSTGFRDYEYARKLKKYSQANIPDKMNKIRDLIDEIQGENSYKQLKITDFIMRQRNKNCDK